MSKINLQEPQHNRNAIANYVYLIMTSTVQCALCGPAELMLGQKSGPAIVYHVVSDILFAAACDGAADARDLGQFQGFSCLFLKAHRNSQKTPI